MLCRMRRRMSGRKMNPRRMRLRGDVSDRREIDKAVAFLQRRGFSWQDIRGALAAYGQDIPDGME